MVDPGLVDTDITRHMPMSKSITRYFIYPIFWPFMKNPKMGAQGIIHAALDPKMRKISGDYYLNMEKTELSQPAQDFELARWLWRVSEKWTKLKEYKEETITAS
ncbi:hypothetical protein EVAR_25626_1 [Eumeta japonica]|uniref:Uncharacterized protein n=1 Tax=Eumeta variegata TaxID=151549 RepID=A0A4C1V0V1_EUMVA|nr:hypothetical protein EVAR_25626_1 [Eumeta japonica]